MGHEFTVRRVVTGHDPQGRAVFVSDGAPALTMAADTGFGFSQVFVLDGPPRTADAGGDATGAFELEPPPGGLHLLVITLPPPAPGTPDDERWLRVDGDDPARPGMHTTDTLDCMVVLDGRIVLDLEGDGERELGPGDAVIQRGTAHRWRVTGDQPCTYAVLLARPSPATTNANANAGSNATGVVAATAHTGGVRRVVTGPAGAVVDGGAPVVIRPEVAGGVRMTDLWQTGGPLHAVDQGGDPAGPFALEPVGGGIACRIVEFPPGHDPGERGYDTTSTIDIDLVLAGQLELELPDQSPVVLGPGDVVIQRGTNHRWRAAGTEPVRFFAAMIALNPGG